jgi:uncharacterized protein YbjT (DUF2867 family)
MSSSVFLITGATGATGKSTIELLLERGYKVRAFVHQQNKKSAQLQNIGAEIVVGDLLDFTAVRSALEGISGAYFVYPIAPGIVQATAYFAQAALEATVPIVVNMTQINARRNTKSLTSFNHWMAENVFNWSGLAVTHLKPTFFAEWFLYYRQDIIEGLVQKTIGA